MAIGKQSEQRKNLKNWFRKNHYSTFAALSPVFGSCLTYLESRYEQDTGEEITFGECGDIDKGWIQILGAMNQVSEDSIEAIVKHRWNQKI